MLFLLPRCLFIWVFFCIKRLKNMIGATLIHYQIMGYLCSILWPELKLIAVNIDKIAIF